MTIIAFHHTEDDLICIADGLISRGENRVIEQDKKIVLFNPVYKIPKVSMGRFNYFSLYNAGEFGLAYAGNYTLISTIIKNFIERVTRKLVLNRNNNGSPAIYWRDDEGGGMREGRYTDEYNFSDSEIIDVTVNFLANILQEICMSACNDFAINSMSPPDVEFLIFGCDNPTHKNPNRAQVLLCKEYKEQQSVIARYSVLPWALILLGDSSVTPSALSLIESSEEYEKPDCHVESSDWDSECLASKDRNSVRLKREKTIKSEVLRIINNDTGTIGGSCTIATSGWTNKLILKTIRKEGLLKEIDAVNQELAP